MGIIKEKISRNIQSQNSKGRVVKLSKHLQNIILMSISWKCKKN